MKNIITFFFNAKCLFLLIFFASFLLFLAHISYTKTALYSDSRFYFAYTRSLVKDHDIKLTNDFLMMDIQPFENENGLAVNTYSPGTSFFWIPLYWMVDNVVSIYKVDDGLTLLHQISSGFTSIFLATLGLFLIYRVLSDYFPKNISLLATFLLFSTTNLLFYMGVEPLTSHAASFFTTAFFLYFFIKHKKDRYYYLTLGIIAGVCGVVRILDSFILIIPITELLIKKFRIILKLKLVLILTTGFLIGFLPQIYIWKIFFDRYMLGPSWGYPFDFKNPHILYVLFNSQNGLFLLTPIVGIAVIVLLLKTLGFGILKLFEILNLGFGISNKIEKVPPRIFFYALLYFLLHLYLISSWAVFTQGGSYSIRMMISTYPLLSFGSAYLIDYFNKKIGELKTVLGIFILSFTNIVLIIRYLLLF